MAQQRAAGIAIDPLTAFPNWDGRPVDYDQAVSCLMGRQRGAERAPTRDDATAK